MGFPSHIPPHINVSVESQNTYKNDDETNEVFQKIAVELRSHHNQKDLIQLGKDFVAFLVEMERDVFKNKNDAVDALLRVFTDKNLKQLREKNE